MKKLEHVYAGHINRYMYRRHHEILATYNERRKETGQGSASDLFRECVEYVARYTSDAILDRCRYVSSLTNGNRVGRLVYHAHLMRDHPKTLHEFANVLAMYDREEKHQLYQYKQQQDKSFDPDMPDVETFLLRCIVEGVESFIEGGGV